MIVTNNVNYAQPQSPLLSSPNDVIVNHIFSWLNYIDLCQIARCSKRARELAEKLVLWEPLFLRRFYFAVMPLPEGRSKRDFQVCLAQANDIFAKILQEGKPVTDQMLSHTLGCYPVSTVSIQGGDEPVQLTNAGLDTICKRPDPLTSFLLETESRSTFSFLTDADLDSFTKKNRELRCLTLRGCLSITEDGLLASVKNCQKLREVFLNNDHLSDRVVQAVCALPLLRKLEIVGAVKPLTNVSLRCIQSKSLSHFKLKAYEDSFTEEAVHATLASLKGLEFLSFASNIQITDELITTICRNSPGLKLLHLIPCGSITPALFQNSTFASTPSLENLVLGGVVDSEELQKSLQAFREAGGLPNLSIFKIIQ